MQWIKLITDFKTAQEAFKVGIENISSDFQERQKEETGSVSLDNGFLDRQPSDFAVHYCLAETINQVERLIKEKPSRELALAKTKLQEAYFWASQS